MNLVVVKFPSKLKRYLFNVHDYDAVEVGDTVVVATSRGEQKGTVLEKAKVTPGSNIACLIDEWNNHRPIKPVLGIIKYFNPQALKVINEVKVTSSDLPF